MEFNKSFFLNDVVDVLGDGLHGTPNYNEKGEYYFINGNNLKDGQITIKEGTKRVDQKTFQKYKKNLNDRTILVSINGTIGNVALYNNEKVILGKSACYFNVKKDINKNYIKYLLMDKRFQDYIKNYATGTTILNVSLKTMRNFKFYLPDLNTQSKVTSILENIDSLIENNKAIIVNLEKISISLFKHWFIDFECPNEEGKPYKSSGGKMVESELGEIPVNWKVTTISDISKITMGQSPKSDTYNTDKIGLPLLNGAADFKNCNLSPNKYTSDPKKIGNKGDYVFGVRATIGLVTELDNTYAIGRGAGITTPLNSSLKEFVYETLKKAFNEFKYTASGSVYLNISKNDLNDFKLVKPTDKLIEKYHSHMKGILTQKQNLIQENITLKNLRDTLLPKLLSGEIEIPDELEV